MKRLTCEMCGSVDLLKQDGVFVCQSCGTKYSVEEAKKMMIEGTVDISGSTVKIDNSDKINNYLALALSAYESNNYVEVENYCNKVIEIQPSNGIAWMYKGISAGWQSTLSNIRLNEAVECFVKAIEYSKDDEVSSVIEESIKQVKSIAIALISLRGDRFLKWPDDEETAGFVSDLNSIIEAILTLLLKRSIDTKGLLEEIATKLNQIVINTWTNCVENEYLGEEHVSDYDCAKYINRLDNLIKILELAIGLSDSDGKNDIVRYNNINFFLEKSIQAYYFKREWSSFWGNYQWNKYIYLAQSAKGIRQSMIENNKLKVKKIEEDGYAEYWAENEDAKLLLEEERKQLMIEIEQLNLEISQIQQSDNYSVLSKTLSKLKKERDACGIFLGKERKRLEAEIEKIAPKMNEYDLLLVPLNEKVAMNSARISEIDNEFSKKR